MDCLIHLTATLCLMQPSQLEIRADLSSQIGGDIHHVVSGHDYHGALLGHISIEMPLVSYGRFQLIGGVHHYSLADTQRDRGEERAALGFVWRPL